MDIKNIHSDVQNTFLKFAPQCLLISIRDDEMRGYEDIESQEPLNISLAALTVQKPGDPRKLAPDLPIHLAGPVISTLLNLL